MRKPGSKDQTLNPPTNGVSQLMRFGRVATVAALLNDSEFLTILRGLPHADERLEFLRRCDKETDIGIQKKLWETVKRITQPSWEPPGGWRISPHQWQVRACEGCGQRKRIYQGLCRECRKLKFPGADDKFCSNCQRPSAQQFKKGRCQNCYAYLYRTGRERPVDADGRAIPAPKARHTPQARARMVAAQRWRKGIPRSPEVRAAISAALRGHPSHPVSPETRAKISAAGKSRKLTLEQAQRGAAQLKKYWTPERIAGRAASMKGRKLTPEHRANIAAGGLRRKPASPETCAKLSAAVRAHWAKRSKAERKALTEKIEATKAANKKRKP